MTNKPLLGTILLVDNEPLHLKIYKMILEAPNIEILCATDGFEASLLLREHQVDLVITDTNMPKMSGPDLLMHIRLTYPQVPVVIFFSGLIGSDLTEEDLLNMGAVEILKKEEAMPRLRSLVFQLLPSRNQGH